MRYRESSASALRGAVPEPPHIRHTQRCRPKEGEVVMSKDGVAVASRNFGDDRKMPVFPRLNRASCYLAAVALAALVVPSTARADAPQFSETPGYSGAELLACFHPEGATFLTDVGSLTCMPTIEEVKAEAAKHPGGGDLKSAAVPLVAACVEAAEKGKSPYSGKIEYAGALTKSQYHMSYMIEYKTVSDIDALSGRPFSRTLAHVIPGQDSAFLPTNRSCFLTQWRVVATSTRPSVLPPRFLQPTQFIAREMTKAMQAMSKALDDMDKKGNDEMLLDLRQMP
jgi:hypothetical protein